MLKDQYKIGIISTECLKTFRPLVFLQLADIIYEAWDVKILKKHCRPYLRVDKERNMFCNPRKNNKELMKEGR